MLLAQAKVRYNKIQQEYSQAHYKEDSASKSAKTLANMMAARTHDLSSIKENIEIKTTNRADIQKKIEGLKSDLSKVSSDDSETIREIEKNIDSEKVKLEDLDEEIKTLNDAKQEKEKSSLKDNEAYKQLVDTQKSCKATKEQLETELNQMKQGIEDFKTDDERKEVNSWLLAGA